MIRHARRRGLDKDDNFPHLVAGGEPRIADKPPTIFHPKTIGGRKIDFAGCFALYRGTLTPDRSVLFDRYRMADVAFKAVGVGSVGTICVVGLFLSGDGEPLFLQVKQTQRSVLERLAEKLAYQGPQGRRVVDGQRMMQAASDIFLGWTADEPLGLEFYVRILKNRRLGGISELAEQETLSEYSRLCGRTLARSHARTGDPAVIAGYMGRNGAFDDALASFAMAYAGQTIKDHAALVKARGEAAGGKSAGGREVGTKVRLKGVGRGGATGAIEDVLRPRLGSFQFRGPDPGSTQRQISRGEQGAGATGGFEKIALAPDRRGPAGARHAHGANARRRRGPHVGVAVADHHRLIRAKSQFPHRLSEHSGRGLPAIAAVPGSVRAEIDRLEPEPLRRQHRHKPIMNPLERRRVEEPARDS